LAFTTKDTYLAVLTKKQFKNILETFYRTVYNN